MNSEVVSGGGRRSREHRRYLSIGESERGAVFEDGEDSDGRPGSRVLFPSRGRDAAGGDGNDMPKADDGKANVVAGLRDMRIFGGMTKLGPPSDNGTNRFAKSRTGSMYDGDGFLKELDAWLR